MTFAFTYGEYRHHRAAHGIPGLGHMAMMASFMLRAGLPSRGR